MPTPRVSAAGGAMPATVMMEVTPSLRRALELLMDGLVLMLDELDGDVDLEGEASAFGSTDLDLEWDVADAPHDEHDQDPLEHTANETAGRGFFSNLGPRDDDAEEDDSGIADADAMSIERGEEGMS